MNCALFAFYSHTTLTVSSRNKAIVEYLHSHNYTEAFAALSEEAGVNFDPKAKKLNILEKKLSILGRLSKKVSRLLLRYRL